MKLAKGPIHHILLVVLTTHYMACCWHWITGEDQNAPNAVAPGAPTSEQYLSDFYYCTLLLQGQGDSSGTTPMQNLFSTFAVVLGSLILAIVFGNVGMLVSNFNANSTNYQRKMETVFATMNKLQLPHDMRERISLHYEHLWEEYEPLDGDIVRFPQLTHTLALEVGLYRYMNLILKMSYWRECSPDFVTQIVLKLVARVYLPDDYVLRQGEVGDEMYMVNRGLCEFAEDEKTEDDSIGLSTKGSGCESSDNSAPALHVRRAYSNETLPSSSGIEASDEAGAVHPVPSLKPVVGTSIASGESFGGMALLMNYPSKTGVRAVTYIEMCVLERTKFQQLLARYPDDRRRVLRSMLAACVDKRDIPFTRKEIDQMMARKRQKPMDDSDHVSMKELVEALLGSMKQPSADQTNGFRNRVQVDYAGEFIKITPRRLHRRRSGRSRSGSSGSLTNVLKLSNEVPRADTLISAAADSSMEHQKRLQAHVDAVDARIQALKRKQAQYTEALHRIAAQIEPKCDIPYPLDGSMELMLS